MIVTLLVFLSLILGAFLAAVFYWATWIEPRSFQVNRHEVTIPKWLDHPLRILHLSDTHFAKPDRHLSRFFDQLAKLDYHFVFLTGDIMDCEEGIPICVENLKKLRPTHGFFAVFGNHDYYDYRLLDVFTHNFPGQKKPLREQHSDLLKEALEGIGVRVLKNETATAYFEGNHLLIHGLDDPTTGRANVRQAMHDFHPKEINLLLTHTVDAFLDIGENEIDVSFSGHSHGGQIRLPGVGPIISHTMIGRQYASGILSYQGAVCSISRGVNASRYFYLRLLCPPEAILLTLRGQKSA